MTDRVPVTFGDGAGAVAAHVGRVKVTDGEVRVELHLAVDTYAAVERRALFHLSPLARGPGADRFRPADEVRVEAQLSPKLAPGVLSLVPDAASIRHLLTTVDPASPLLATEAWYARVVSQRVESSTADGDDDAVLREGYRTAWGSGPRDQAPLPLLAILAEYLDRRGWDVSPLDEQPGFRWNMSSAGRSWRCVAVVDDEAGWCAMLSVLDGEVADERRLVVAGQLGELNAGLLFGSWELDETGSVRLRSTIELPDRAGAATLIEHLIERNIDTTAAHLAQGG
ncbi:MAG TPA: YbjN domain-containing protein [Ilumatobacter sp.]|nr:YbjN domain-containing protein [Ilumatobacter sp.]